MNLLRGKSSESKVGVDVARQQWLFQSQKPMWMNQKLVILERFGLTSLNLASDRWQITLIKTYIVCAGYFADNS